jgi:hypothetical protein
MWAVGQRGLFICIFKWDLSKYITETQYNNFFSLIPTGWTKAKFAQHNIDIETEIINGVEEIRLVFWDLSNRAHWQYINGLFHSVVNTIVCLV